MTGKGRLFSGLLGVLLLSAGCATAGGRETAELAVRQPTHIQVENQNWALVNVYAERDGLFIRLGSVTTGSTETFQLPPEMQNAVGARLVVEPLAERVGYVSPPLEYDQDMKLTVANQISLSTLVPWRSGD